jgi:hypothetical protein
MMKRSFILLSLVLVMALVITACASEPAAPEEASPAEESEEMAVEEPTPVPEPTATTDTGYDTFAPFAGTWTGSWTNTTFGSTGAIEANIAFDPDGTGTFTFDAGGFIFGAFDPPEVTFSASFDASGVTIDLPGDAIFGDVTVTINPDGTFTMVGDLVPTDGIARVEATGTFTETTIEGTYTVFFDGSGVAEGTFSMTRSS